MMEKLFAIPTLHEAELLISKSGFQPTDDPDLFNLPGAGWKLLISGIGIVPTIYNLTKHFSSNKYQKVVHAGIAGSYFLPLQPGEVVQVTRDTFADVGIDHGGVFRWVFHEGLWAPDKSPFKSGWMEVEEDKELKIECVSSITVDLVTASPERKAKMIERFNPQIESMEGAAVFYVCKRESIPVMQIRSISNFTGIRDRKSWKIEEAIESLTNTLIKLI
jgi:futalosine hydrolase